MLPNFLIIGAPRTGTTTIYEGLRQHFEIYMSYPIKEPEFWSFDEQSKLYKGPGDEQGIRDYDSYVSLFNEAEGKKAVGEASTLYLYSKKAPLNIKKNLPGVKLIAVLRNPIERSFSNYCQHVLHGREKLSFADALEAEEEREKMGWCPFWCYSKMGFYGEQLTRYLRVFNDEDLKIFLYEDVQSNIAGVLTGIYEFLGVEKCNPIVPIRQNASGSPRSKMLHSFLTKTNKVKGMLRPLIPEGTWGSIRTQLMNWNLNKDEISIEIRKRLLKLYKDDILLTQEIIRRDLTHWLK